MGGYFMIKKILIISGASLAALLGGIGLLKNSKKMKMRRMMRRIGSTMYNVGTMLRTLSLQVAQS